MLVEQAQTLGDNPEAAKAIAAKIRSIKPGDPPLFGASTAYWIDLRGYDPAAAARAIERPMLILQGEADRNVTMTDFQNWKRALSFHKNVTFRSYPGLNHLFMTGAGLPSKDYAQPDHVSGPCSTTSRDGFAPTPCSADRRRNGLSRKRGVNQALGDRRTRRRRPPVELLVCEPVRHGHGHTPAAHGRCMY